MTRRPMMTLFLPILALSATYGATARAADALPPAEEWVPRQALIVLNVRDPNALLELALRPKLIEAMAASPLYKARTDNEGFRRFQNVVKSLERRLKADWQTILRRLLGGGATWAIGPNQGSLFIIDALDAEAPKALHEMMLQIVRPAAANSGQPTDIRPTKVGEVDTWSIGPKEAHAILGRRVVIASSPKVLEAVLNLRGGPRGSTVASVPAYQQVMKAAGADAVAMLYANTAVLKNVPNVAKALAGDGNPLVALLAAPITEAISRSTWLTLALKVKGEMLTLEAITDGAIAATGAARFAVPAQAGDGALPDLAVPRRIAAMSLHRDLRGFYAAKDDLFPQRTSGLIFFENMMETVASLQSFPAGLGPVLPMTFQRHALGGSHHGRARQVRSGCDGRDHAS